jgi:hypothetical protein
MTDTDIDFTQAMMRPGGAEFHVRAVGASCKIIVPPEMRVINEMHAIMAEFRQLSHMGATVIVLHNRSEKSESNYRGSTVIKHDADVGYMLTNTGIDGKLGSIRLTPFKMRVLVSGIAFLYTDAGFVEDETVPRPVRDWERLRDLLIANPSVTGEKFEKLAQESNLRQAHARRFLKEMVVAGQVERTRGAKNTQHYRFVTQTAKPSGARRKGRKSNSFGNGGKRAGQ